MRLLLPWQRCSQCKRRLLLSSFTASLLSTLTAIVCFGLALLPDPNTTPPGWYVLLATVFLVLGMVWLVTLGRVVLVGFSGAASRAKLDRERARFQMESSGGQSNKT